jgi:3-phosphoshikimate 1-carboxyvinyltransferase
LDTFRPGSAWRIEVPPGPAQWSCQPGGDRLASLCALAAAALASGPVQVWGLAECEATISLRRVLALLGVQFVSLADGWLTVTPPPAGLTPLAEELDCGRDIGTLLIALGVAAGLSQPVSLCCTGDQPDGGALEVGAALLEGLGARLTLRHADGRSTAQVEPAALQAAELAIPLSLQPVKTLAILAALQATGTSGLTEAAPGPDHLERALHQLGASLDVGGRRIEVAGGRRLEPRSIKVPPDLGSAAALIVAAAARPETELILPMVGLNPTRSGFLRVLQRAGADIRRERDWQFGTEPVSELRVSGGRGTALQLAPNAAAGLLPELPLLAVYATQQAGTSLLRGAGPLRAGVPDRLALAAELLRAFGAAVELRPDGLAVSGPMELHGAEGNCADDRLLGRMGLAAALLARGPSLLHGTSALDLMTPELQFARPERQSPEP